MAKQNLKKKAWRKFSEYYRRKNADGYEYCTCYTCGAYKPWKQMQVGHILDGRTNAILFNEDCVRIQCYACNVCKHGNKEVFIPKIIDEIGRHKYNTLRLFKNITVKYSEEDLTKMILFWEKQINDFYRTKNQDT